MNQCFSFGPEPRVSGGTPQFGRICAMECAIKAGLCRRSSRRVNMMARRNPASAPRNPSVIARLLKVRRPWPVRRNPVYAIATVQKIARAFMGPHTARGISNIVAKRLVPVKEILRARKPLGPGWRRDAVAAIVDVNWRFHSLTGGVTPTTFPFSRSLILPFSHRRESARLRGVGDEPLART